MKTLKILLFTVITGLVVPGMADAQTFTILPSKDNTIYSEGDVSNGSGIYLFAGLNKKLAERRALLKFDLSEIDPADSLTSVTLTLHVSRTVVDSRSFKLSRMTADWGEGQSDAVFEEGGGAEASSGDATWNYGFYNTTAWTNKGGDFSSGATLSFDINDTGTYILSDEGLRTDVREWLDDPQKNFGWIIFTTGTTESAKRFNSRENPENKPVLTVTTSPADLFNPPVRSENFSVYPNPSEDGDFYIRTRGLTGIDEIRVFDLNGREIGSPQLSIQPGSASEFRLHISTKGIYLIEINRIFHRKVIVR